MIELPVHLWFIEAGEVIDDETGIFNQTSLRSCRGINKLLRNWDSSPLESHGMEFPPAIPKPPLLRDFSRDRAPPGRSCLRGEVAESGSGGGSTVWRSIGTGAKVGPKFPGRWQGVQWVQWVQLGGWSLQGHLNGLESTSFRLRDTS